MVKESNGISKVSIGSLIKDAEALLDSKNYGAALKKIDQAIIQYGQKKRTQKNVWEKLYNLKVIVSIHRHEIDNAIAAADKLNSLISNKTDVGKLPIYYGNCALAYRMRNCESIEYEESAKKAYMMAKKSGSDDGGYYSCLYAVALFDTEQYTTAYKIAKEALKEFKKLHNDMSKWDKENYIMYVRIKGNIAEISVAYSKALKDKYRRRMELLLEAQANILDIIDIKELEDDGMMRKEIYSIAVKVFEALRDVYV